MGCLFSQEEVPPRKRQPMRRIPIQKLCKDIPNLPDDNGPECIICLERPSMPVMPCGAIGNMCRTCVSHTIYLTICDRSGAPLVKCPCSCNATLSMAQWTPLADPGAVRVYHKNLTNSLKFGETPYRNMRSYDEVTTEKYAAATGVVGRFCAYECTPDDVLDALENEIRETLDVQYMMLKDDLEIAKRGDPYTEIDVARLTGEIDQINRRKIYYYLFEHGQDSELVAVYETIADHERRTRLMYAAIHRYGLHTRRDTIQCIDCQAAFGPRMSKHRCANIERDGKLQYKPCPNCKVMCVRGEGCRHVRCSRCNYEFEF